MIEHYNEYNCSALNQPWYYPNRGYTREANSGIGFYEKWQTGAYIDVEI